MLQGTTKSGFEFDVKEDNLDDYVLLKKLSAVSKGESGKIVDVIEMLLGDDQEEKLMNHIAELHDGKVSARAMIAEVKEIFEALKPKNS